MAFMIATQTSFRTRAVYDRLTFTEALTKRLQVMDSTAFSLCMDNKIPIVVFNMYKPGILRDAVLGRNVGTLVLR